MSDTIHPAQDDRKRTLTSLAAAVGVHAVILVVLTLAFTLRSPSPEFTIPIDVQIDSGREGAGQELSQGSASGPGLPSRAPGAAQQGKGSDASGGFVIPTVRGPAPDSAPNPGGGASFREAGGRTGTGGTLPPAQNQVLQPAGAESPAVSGSGAGFAAGAAAGSGQRSGEGVSVGESNGSSGKLDYGKLDQALAGRQAGTSGAAGTQAGAGQAGGSSGSGGGGGSPGRAGGGSGGRGGAGDVLWDRPDANKGRMLLPPRVDPKLPAWVGKQGLTLSVIASFVVMPDGVVSLVSIDRSSGNAEVDSAVRDAISRWRFSAVKDAEPMRGLIPYVINPR